jgi:hypothetical protein
MPSTQKRRSTARPTPKWKLKRRRCLTDNKLFHPKLQRQRFCSDACRKEFHRYGESYGPIKMGLEKALQRKYVELRREFFSEIKDQSRRIDRLEKMIESEPNSLREEFERHTHELYTDGSGGEIETSAPTEARAIASERFRALRNAALSNVLKPDAKPQAG